MYRYMKGIVTGTVIGMAAAMMIIPSMDRRTQKTVRRVSRKMIDVAGDAYDGVMDLMN